MAVSVCTDVRKYPCAVGSARLLLSLLLPRLAWLRGEGLLLC